MKPVIAESLLQLPDFYLSPSMAARVIAVGARRFYRLVANGALTPDGFVDGEMRFLYSQLMEYVRNGRPGSRRFSHRNNTTSPTLIQFIPSFKSEQP